MSFFLGLDLGQAQDYTAMAIIERVEQDGVACYHGRHLERFRLGTPYPAIIQRVGALVNTEPLRDRCTIVADATGVGRPVLDLLHQANLSVVGIYITSGDTVTHEGSVYRVPKRDLVSTLQVLLQGGRLKFADRLPEVATLVKELLAFQVKVTANAHDTYGVWREGQHDDLVLAVAMACWYGERYAPLLLWADPSEYLEI